MAFTASDVKNLREMTGVGMLDCKKALAETDGDIDKAIEYLREKGLAAAQKKAGRIAAEGMAVATVIDGIGAVVEVNAETDFVAQNDMFVEFAKGVATVVAKDAPADVDDLLTKAYPETGRTVAEELQEKVLVIGENIKIRRFARYAEGLSVAYNHMGGRIGVLVNMEVTGEVTESIITLGKDMAMQIAAMNPAFLDKSDVNQDTLEKEREILMAQAMTENETAKKPKPQNIIEKMVEGRVGKYYEENCLMQQAFVKENKSSVEQHAAQVAKEAGATIAMKGFVRFEKGEGIEKKEDNFAAEVASMMG